ncbi:hypothetical protein [Alicyclobacillus sp. ALC3]|uniref:hypothetical protein n=1 Tax=Alicyclobacillus sp. ALC3 TaxID=2796143 RepID=UPI002378E580|nr:hypothetical protein [Alicyclobacillus sp. ALC3]WDL95684.1 hypothetical protein JC200_15040 [Alicyclobacillus sp. ALC3]
MDSAGPWRALAESNQKAGAYGYVGNGILTTNLAGRLLRDLMLATASNLTELPVVQHRSPSA